MKRVRNKETGEYGFVITDSFGCCSDEELLVVYDGTNTGCGTDEDLLQTVGFDIPNPIPAKCGAGRVKECCIFLVAGKDGFTCERFTPLRDSLIFRTMTAERNPEEAYPDCMKFGE
jgi:hypothetical protein